MGKTCVFNVIAVFAMTLVLGSASARELPGERVRFDVVPERTLLPPDLAGLGVPSRTAAAADTFVLGDFSFETPSGTPDEQGFVHVDWTDQIKAYFHVDDGATNLTGGTFGNLVPIGGGKSMWCGEPVSTAVPFCGYASLPGYGNGWDQILQSDFASGDSLTLSYDVFWDSEGGYDATVVQVTFNGGATWANLPVTDTLSATPGAYDNTGIAGGITESFAISGAGGVDNISVRFRFTADGAWSDEDGLWPTDGAIIVDNISVEHFDGGTPVSSNTEDFEAATTGSNTAGIWTGKKAPIYGDFADLYPGVSTLQEDPCTDVFLFVWGFFDDPTRTNYNCHLPDPRPEVGAVPFGTAEGIYLDNSVWSPAMANIGSGFEYRLRYRVYLDLPLDNLQFHQWQVRSWTAGCPGRWRDFNFVYYGGARAWADLVFDVGSAIDPAADAVQIAVGAVDMCQFWCNIYGSGACHSHGPLIDDVRLERIASFGPQYTVANLGLFQDTFASDGTLSGTARADAAVDIMGGSRTTILPGDSCVFSVSPLGPHTGVEGGPAVYTYVAVQPFGQAGKTPADLESPELRNGSKRYPLVGTTTASGVTWAIFRMDTVITPAGGIIPDRYAIDLNDNVLTPGDTIHYFFGADASAGAGDENYWSRPLNGQGVRSGFTTTDINEASSSPLEFTILPAGGYNRGGDILYVDDADDRSGPPQLFFDTAFDLLSIGDLVDRYDTLAPSSAQGNELDARVTNRVVQIIDVYKKIIWNTANLSSATIGDGTGNPEKSDSFGLLFQFLDSSQMGPGLYLSGDDIAEEWLTLAGPGAIGLRSLYMNFNLLSGSHVSHGESVSPTLTAIDGGPWDHGGGVGDGDKVVAYGGCAVINDFDVLAPTGNSVTQWPYPNSSDAAVLSKRTVNAAGDTATVVLSGYSYHYTRDASPTFPPARVEFMRDLLIFLGNPVGNAVGVPGPQYANALENNYPNPFNPTTTIKYSIKERAHVSLKIYNAAGQLVKTLVNGVQAPDQIKPVTWDGRNNAGQTVSSGVYFYKLVTKNFSQTKKMVLLK